MGARGTIGAYGVCVRHVGLSAAGEGRLEKRPIIRQRNDATIVNPTTRHLQLAISPAT
jgi:hypothetical protein